MTRAPTELLSQPPPWSYPSNTAYRQSLATEAASSSPSKSGLAGQACRLGSPLLQVRPPRIRSTRNVALRPGFATWAVSPRQWADVTSSSSPGTTPRGPAAVHQAPPPERARVSSGYRGSHGGLGCGLRQFAFGESAFGVWSPSCLPCEFTEPGCALSRSGRAGSEALLQPPRVTYPAGAAGPPTPLGKARVLKGRRKRGRPGRDVPTGWAGLIPQPPSDPKWASLPAWGQGPEPGARGDPGSAPGGF